MGTSVGTCLQSPVHSVPSPEQVAPVSLDHGASKLSIGLTGRGPDMHVYICQYVHAGDLAAQHH
jgi:hypothetical protein